MNSGERRKPTLKELMMMQGKIKPQGETARPAASGSDLKRQMEKAQRPAPRPQKNKWQETRDGRIKTMIEQDPEQAAELLKKLFLDRK